MIINILHILLVLLLSSQIVNPITTSPSWDFSNGLDSFSDWIFILDEALTKDCYSPSLLDKDACDGLVPATQIASGQLFILFCDLESNIKPFVYRFSHHVRWERIHAKRPTPCIVPPKQEIKSCGGHRHRVSSFRFTMFRTHAGQLSSEPSSVAYSLYFVFASSLANSKDI